jgi:hypothetical protein
VRGRTGHRPGTTRDTVVVEVYFTMRSGRQAVLTVSNQELQPKPTGPTGPKFEVTDEELAEFVLGRTSP